QPEVTAIRELEEETGYTTDHLSYVTSFYTSPGFADEKMHVYITDDLKKLDTPVTGDDDEFVEVVELTLEEAKQYVADERIQDATYCLASSKVNNTLLMSGFRMRKQITLCCIWK